MKPQDFDRLSAYLDHQLSPGEKAALEQRLDREPELRAALSELRLTVKALRALPLVKPPRSFTLNAAQVGAVAQPRRAASLFGTLRLAASLSAAALVLVVGGDFAASRGLLGPAASPAAEIVFLTTEESSANAQNADPAATPAEELGIMSAEAITDAITYEAPAGGSDAPPSPEGTPDLVAGLAPVTPTVTADRLAEATPAADTADIDGTGAAGETELAQGTPSTKTVPADATSLAYATDALESAEIAESPGETPQAPPGPGPGLPSLRLLEAALAMLTVLLGLGTWLASRNT